MKKVVIVLAFLAVGVFGKELLITISKDFKISTSKLQKTIEGKLIPDNHKDIVIKGNTKIEFFPDGKKIVNIFWNNIVFKKQNKYFKPLTSKLSILSQR